MKREELKELGLTEEQLEAVMKKYGESLNPLKVELEEKVAEISGLTKTIEEANTTIQGFKEMNVDEIKSQAEEWKLKYEQDIQAKEAEILQVRRNHAIELELGKVKVKNPSLFMKALDFEKVTFEDGVVGGLSEQIEALRESDSYLFVEEPTIQKGGIDPKLSGKSGINDADRAIYEAMGVKPPEK